MSNHPPPRNPHTLGPYGNSDLLLSEVFGPKLRNPLFRRCQPTKKRSRIALPTTVAYTNESTPNMPKVLVSMMCDAFRQFARLRVMCGPAPEERPLSSRVLQPRARAKAQVVSCDGLHSIAYPPGPNHRDCAPNPTRALHTPTAGSAEAPSRRHKAQSGGRGDGAQDQTLGPSCVAVVARSITAVVRRGLPHDAGSAVRVCDRRQQYLAEGVAPAHLQRAFGWGPRPLQRCRTVLDSIDPQTGRAGRDTGVHKKKARLGGAKKTEDEKQLQSPSTSPMDKWNQ